MWYLSGQSLPSTSQICASTSGRVASRTMASLLIQKWRTFSWARRASWFARVWPQTRYTRWRRRIDTIHVPSNRWEKENCVYVHTGNICDQWMATNKQKTRTGEKTRRRRMQQPAKSAPAAPALPAPIPMLPAHRKDNRGEWQSGVCSCCEDFAVCYYGLCCPAMASLESRRLANGQIVEGTDYCTGLTASICCWTGFCCPIIACSVYETRKQMAERYNLKFSGGCCSADCWAALCCLPCVSCQQVREVHARRPKAVQSVYSPGQQIAMA